MKELLKTCQEHVAVNTTTRVVDGVFHVIVTMTENLIRRFVSEISILVAKDDLHEEVLHFN
jgi:hypothetical protein